MSDDQSKRAGEFEAVSVERAPVKLITYEVVREEQPPLKLITYEVTGGAEIKSPTQLKSRTIDDVVFRREGEVTARPRVILRRKT